MPRIFIANRDGSVNNYETNEAVTLMEAIRDSGADELLALCGGCCSCATCHIHVEPGFFSQLPVMSGDENDLLDSTSHRNEFSRLACQIRLTPALDGLRVTIAEED